MSSFKRPSLLLVIFILLSSCSLSLPKLNGIDSKLWKDDKNGCNGNRSKMVDAITHEKDKLKALTEMEILQMLGRPDENDLLPRSQKIFVYYLEPGPLCNAPRAEPRQLILRINAMSMVKESQVK